MRKYIITLLIVILFQTGIYLYLDRVILVPSAKFSQQAIIDKDIQSIDPQKVSTDQKYYVRLQTAGVMFYSANNQLQRRYTLKQGEKVSYFSWVPKTEIALVGITRNSAKGATVTLKPINLETNSHPVEPRISGLPRGSEIIDVAFAPQVNVTYMLIKENNFNAIYRTDANNNLRLLLHNASVQRIAALQSEDMLIYDDNHKGIVYSLTKVGLKVLSPSTGKYVLIGTDKDNTIYIGKLSGPGVVSTILKGTVNGDFKKFTTLNFAYPVASITVNNDGKLRLM
jgi:hypothetical protein